MGRVLQEKKDWKVGDAMRNGLIIDCFAGHGKKLVEANCGYLKVGERMPNMRIDDSGQQLRFA